MVAHKCTEKENINNLQIHNATMAEQIKDINSKVNTIDKKIDDLPAKMEKIFVSKIEFESHKTNLLIMQRILYGMVGLVLTAIIIALIKTVIR